MSYRFGIYEFGMILSYEEFKHAAKEYTKICGDMLELDDNDRTKIYELAILEDNCTSAWVAGDELNMYTARLCLNSSVEHEKFTIKKLISEYCENIYIDAINDESYGAYDCAYIVTPSKDISLQNLLNHKIYGSMFELIYEFKSKMRRYLPEDFDFERHIGIISYVEWYD